MSKLWQAWVPQMRIFAVTLELSLKLYLNLREHSVVTCNMGKKKTVSGKTAGAGSTEAATTLPDYFNPNVAYHEKLQLALDSILGAFGPDIRQKPALKVSEGGFQAPIDLKVAEARLADENWVEPVLISGGVNALWCNPLSTLTPNVPIEEKRVLDLMRSSWPDDRVHPINEAIDLLADPAVQCSEAWRRVSDSRLTIGLQTEYEQEGSFRTASEVRKALVSKNASHVTAQAARRHAQGHKFLRFRAAGAT